MRRERLRRGEREEAAADRIFGLLPEDQQKELRELFEEFEAYETPEARFAHTMDNFQPVLSERFQRRRRLEGTRRVPVADREKK